MEFVFTARFVKTLKKLPNLIVNDVHYVIEEFKDKDNHKRLKLHKLQGVMKKYHAFSANYHYRIIIKIEVEEITFIDVGDHSIYD